MDINKLIRLLKEAAITRKLIQVSEKDRCNGKTTSLVLFAKEHGFSAVVDNRQNVKFLKEMYDYEHIYDRFDIILGDVPIKQIVVDDCVNVIGIPHDFEVITGFEYVSEKVTEENFKIDKVELNPSGHLEISGIFVLDGKLKGFEFTYDIKQEVAKMLNLMR